MYCWTYAKSWCEFQPKIEAANAVGPIFVSIGDQEKLLRFLELNPHVPRDQMFVDDYNFQAYKSLGFRNIGETKVEEIKLRTPELGGFREWFRYLSNSIRLSPIEEGKMGVPEGVLRLGGTFVVKGSDVVYQWNDSIPGDTPELEDVMKFVESE